jgi:hypothetical protein
MLLCFLFGDQSFGRAAEGKVIAARPGLDQGEQKVCSRHRKLLCYWAILLQNPPSETR